MWRIALLAAVLVFAAPSGAYDGTWDARIEGHIAGTMGGEQFTQRWCCGSQFVVKGATATSHLVNGTVSQASGVAHIRWNYHGSKTCPLTLRLLRSGTWRAAVRCTFVFASGTFPVRGTVVVRRLHGP